jgi:MFS family permease
MLRLSSSVGSSLAFLAPLPFRTSAPPWAICTLPSLVVCFDFVYTIPRARVNADHVLIGQAMTYYAIAVVGGPTLGPVIGSSLTVNLGFRWPSYILAIWVFTVIVFAFFCLPESYSPVLLKKKAQRLRKETGDSRWHHPHEDVKLDVKTVVTKHLARPIIMLTTEPMVTCIAFYASFVYGILYMTLEVFPIVFAQNRGWPLITSTLPFLALFVGVLFAVLVNLANQPRYARAVDANKGRPVSHYARSKRFLKSILKFFYHRYQKQDYYR